MSHRNMLLMLVTTIISYACYVRAEQNPYSRYVAAGFSVIDRWALQEPPDQELFEGAMHGMVSVLRKHGDEYSLFVDAKKRENFREDLRQEFGGVGVRIRLLGDPPQPTVMGPPEPGTPAFSADIRSGDRIVAIDKQPTAGMAMLDVLQHMRGKPGAAITLTLLHEGQTEPVDIRLERATITVPSILGDIHADDGTWQFRLTTDPRIAYIRITKFGDKTVAEMTRVLEKLAKPEAGEGIGALVLDMRDNYGGALDAAVAISDMFLRGGLPIVTTRGRDKAIRDRYVSTGWGVYTEIPVAVLINHESASASEIVAACLQDYDRAVVIGERSYGKGTVQRLMRVESGRSLLKLTSATYWRPSGKNIHRMPSDGEEAQWGVTPDPGLDVKLDEAEYVNWRKYRHHRDLFGNSAEGNLTSQIDQAVGQLPESFTDRVLDRAVAHLQQRLGK